MFTSQTETDKSRDSRDSPEIQGQHDLPGQEAVIRYTKALAPPCLRSPHYSLNASICVNTHSVLGSLRVHS